MKKLSIIVPVYNVEKYIDRCIKSLINQSLTDIEIILVDDQSPDSCPQICEEWTKNDSRIKVIHKKNGGLGYARNSGLKLATGEYVSFIDSDDCINNEAYAKAYEVAKKNDLDICFFKSQRFFTEKDINPNKENGEMNLFIGRGKVDNFLLNMVGPLPNTHKDGIYAVSCCMAIYKREIIEKNKIFFISEKHISGEDMIFHLDLLPKVSNVGIIPNCYYYYFVNPHSITHHFSKNQYKRMILNDMLVYKKLKSLYPRNKYIDHYKTYVMKNLRTILNFEARIDSSFSKKRQVIYKTCKEPINQIFDNKYIRETSLKNGLIALMVRYKFTTPIIILYKYIYPILKKRLT